MPRNSDQRLIDLESRVAFQDRTHAELDEQLRWAVEQLQGLQHEVARLHDRLEDAPDPRAPSGGIGYDGGEGAQSSSPPKGRT